MEKLGSIVSIKAISYFAFIFNILSLVFGLIYLLTMNNYSSWWDIGGIIYLITLFGNFLLIYLDSIRVNRTHKIGNRISLLGYFYLAFIILAMLGMFLGNFIYSVTYSPEVMANLGSFVLVYLSYFGGLILGFIIAYLNIRKLKVAEIWDTTHVKETSSRMRLVKLALMLLCYLILFLGIYFVLITYFGADLLNDEISGAIGMFVGQFDLFFVFLVLADTIILLKLKDRTRSPRSYYGIAIIGIFLTGFLIIPFCATPYSISSAEQNFSIAFGADWQTKIPANVTNQYFLKTPFSTPEYFLGMTTTNYLVNTNVQFYDADGIRLFFDVYTPKADATTLPGNNSVIIRIHGGGWVSGDKGWANMMQMNKYFAAQGYIVFDIQYGLHESSSFFNKLLPTPSYLVGNFTVNDMLKHIGNFTQYLAEYADEYKANLKSVFISGGSAGGHLTCATALAIASGNYTAIFGNNLTIKGFIPLYPANGHSTDLGVTGSPEFISPDDYLVNVSSPPCLDFQGTQDGIVHPSISQDLKNAYTAAGNSRCAIIYLPFGGHASDLYYTGYYNQVFLYYMERFMYLCGHNLI
jgi:acetyl esterase/lipase